MRYIISQIRKNACFLVFSLLYKEDIKSTMLVMCIKISLIIAINRGHFFAYFVTECKEKQQQ